MDPTLFLAAALSLATTFGANTGEGGTETDVGGTASEEVPIKLPTDKYHCNRLPVTYTGNTLAVMVGCTDREDKPLFIFGAMCRTDVPDADLAVIVLNVNEAGVKPRPVQIALTCSSKRTGYNL